jgi:peptide deformylase
MAVRKILLLGDPSLYEPSAACRPDELDEISRITVDLHDTLFDFRAIHGFGRAIAAPQIGVRKRLFYLFVDTPIVFINPVLERVGTDEMELWDDCMSFPGLLVRVKRARRCRIDFLDAQWQPCSMGCDGGLSELVQHEYDHLDGILAVQRAIDSRSLALETWNG